MKRHFLSASLLLSLSIVVSACSSESPPATSTDISSETASSATPDMVVYKSPTCGCCEGWIHYVEKAGFSVRAIDHDNVDAIKAEHGLTDPALKSCHTASVDGYVIEGHVPVSDIERLLAERPNVVGLSAPGMPPMSPGMASETPKDYDVLAFDKNGRTRVFASY